MSRFLVLTAFALQAILSCQAQEHARVRGVVVLTRNGDRQAYYQDAASYKPHHTDTTPLGEAQSFNLGSFLRSTYLDQSNPNHIRGIKTDIADIKQVYIRSKAGGEGTVCFDSSIALLQGLFPPTTKNKIVLANETTIVAPLGGYQYIPVETVEPSNDRSLESWTNCPAFEKHVSEVYGSNEFNKHAKDAAGFLNAAHDYVYGQELSLRNAHNVHDFIHTQLTHNRTYAFRLPPTFIEQSRALADYHEYSVFSDKHIGGIGNIAGRSILHSILYALERIEFNGDPLQLFVQQTTYQPFISLFNMLDIVKDRPELKGIPDFASALAIELRRGEDGDSRDFVRFKFRNGTTDGDFKTVHVFGHNGDIPLTEFIYRTQNYAINSNKEWASVCNNNFQVASLLEVTENTTFQTVATSASVSLLVAAIVIAVLRVRAARNGKIRLEEQRF